MAKEKQEKKKVKLPTAQKRDIQSKKRSLDNKAFKSTVHTALRSLEKALTTGTAEQAQPLLSKVFSLFDKGVKTKRFKLNKANRIKSRLHKKTEALKKAASA